MAFPISHRWKNLTIASKLYFVVGIMGILILIQLVTLRFAMSNLSAVRAFIGGEGLWTKGQKQAIYHLQRYALTQREADYLAFTDALRINEGNHLARLELSKPKPDMKIVYQGLLLGSIHPDDIEPIVLLITRFKNISYISEAIGIWSQGDQLINELRIKGKKFNELITSGKGSPKNVFAFSDQLKDINDRLLVITANFSIMLGEGSRRLEYLVFMILFLLVLTVETVGLTLTFFTSQSISGGLRELIRVANKIGEGEFDQRLEVTSGDEIGELTVAVNSMGSMLQKSYRELLLSHQQLEEKIKMRTHELSVVAKENAELYEKAKIAVKMRDEFLSIASHELRTPITSLQLHLQMLEKMVTQKDRPTDSQKICEIAHRGVVLGRRLSSLQDVLMDLTRISLGKIEIKKVSVDLVAVARESVSQFSSDALIKLVAPTELNCKADAVRVGQVITNLVTNAIKYGDGSPIEVTLSKDQTSAIVSVTDHGPGIPEEKRVVIFERFERASCDAGVSGLGLGLYISQQIVEAHGGKLTLDSKLDYGSTFKMIIPLAA